MPIDPKNKEQLKRIDDNLQVIRDKIEEAERISGSTRSEFLEKVSTVKPKQKKPLEMELTIDQPLGKDVSVNNKKKKVKVDAKDPLNIKKMLRRRTFSLLKNRIEGKTLLGG